jgi:hypothetical protein
MPSMMPSALRTNVNMPGPQSTPGASVPVPGTQPVAPAPAGSAFPWVPVLIGSGIAVYLLLRK